jgi:hypothetical protein
LKPRIEGVVLALGMAARIFACGFLAGFAVDARGLVVRVAHPGGREPRQPRIEIGAQLRRGNQLPDAHTIGPLATPGEAPLTRAVGVGEFPIGIDSQRTPMRHLFQLVGTQFRRLPGQEALGFLHRIDRYGIRQVADEGLDHPHMLTVEQAVAPYLRRGRQLGRQLLAGESRAGRQLYGIAEPAAGLGAADPQLVGDHFVDRATDIGGILFRQSRDHVVAH